MENEVKTEPTTQPDPPKPKRVLTEAQRLAFMKGREKRLANLERKRQEKLEAEGVEEPPLKDVSPPPPMPVLQRQTNHLDGEVMAQKIAELVYGRLIEEAPPKRKYTRREKPAVIPREESPPPEIQQPIPQKTFNWM